MKPAAPSRLGPLLVLLTVVFLTTIGNPAAGLAAVTLDGERLRWDGLSFNGNFTCDITQNVITYQLADGDASGPFGGLFREEGRISIGTGGRWTGRFTVSDADTGAILVKGDTSGTSTATCDSFNFGESVSGDAFATLNYTVTIFNSTGGILAIVSGKARARLHFTRRGDNVTGSQFFESLGGVNGFTLSGQVLDDTVQPLVPVPGAVVQVCQLPSGPCSLRTADGTGAFSFIGLVDPTTCPPSSGCDEFEIRTDPPAGVRLLSRVDAVTLTGTAVRDQFLHAPVAPPTGTTITSRGTNPDGLPIVYWRDPLILTTTGCSGATQASYSIEVDPTLFVFDVMTEGPAGTYTASIAPLDPTKGYGSVAIDLTCPGHPAPTEIRFDIYVDPSGAVRTTTGQPVPGATVTLFRAETPGGLFTAVPEGSVTMSIENRDNPDAADTRGLFGWDVIAGTYQVRAEKKGCVSPTDPTQTFVLSPVLAVPPAIADLDLRLSCENPDTKPPATRATPLPAPNANGWNNGDVTVGLTATDDPGGSGVKEIRFSLTGAQGGSGVVTGSTASVTISAEGSTTLTYFAIDKAGNQEAAKTLVVRIDKTPPTLTCGVSPGQLWPPDHKLVPVTASVTQTDTLSGPAGFVLVSITSNEGDPATDFRGFAVGTPSLSGQLLAERLGDGIGRVYTLVYGGQDLAGNSATCSTTVVVPHDQR